MKPRLHAIGNWLVDMAAFMSVMGRTIVGRFVPVFVIVTAFRGDALKRL